MELIEKIYSGLYEEFGDTAGYFYPGAPGKIPAVLFHKSLEAPLISADDKPYINTAEITLYIYLKEAGNIWEYEKRAANAMENMGFYLKESKESYGKDLSAYCKTIVFSGGLA